MHTHTHTHTHARERKSDEMTPLIIGRGEMRAYFRPAVCLNRRCTQTTTATEIFPSRKLRPRKLAPRTGL
uniref:Uncharacterized protein n=1 Tax=Trichogramma kaykai TaxID=54128 RepID=A0ABD2WH07_9HYME